MWTIEKERYIDTFKTDYANGFIDTHCHFEFMINGNSLKVFLLAINDIDKCKELLNFYLVLVIYCKASIITPFEYNPLGV